ncbi:MAG: hypothetical protein J6Y19_10255, partial [Kiritimatiellae bacterium]|nr:hypothetical protein [Kiritimatiellia bacterium]
SATFTAGKGKKAYTLRFTAEPPAAAATPEKENAANEPFGEYQVSVKPFFDPAQYGIGGFPKDLGIVFHEVTMKPL